MTGAARLRGTATAAAIFLLLACSSPAPPPAPPAPGRGGVSGRVALKPPDGVDPDDFASAARYTPHRLRDVRTVDYARPGPVAVMLLPAAEATAAPAARPGDVEVRVRGTGFEPAVVAVPAGGRVRFVGADGAPHRPYSFSEGRPFRTKAVEAGGAATIAFPRPGVVRVLDEYDTRPELHVVVAATPFAVVTDEDGAWRIPDVPAGEYVLRTWHRRFPPVETPVRVRDGRWTELDVTLGVEGLPREWLGRAEAATSLGELMASEVDPSFTWLSFTIHHAAEAEVDPARAAEAAERLARAARAVDRFPPAGAPADARAFARMGRELADHVVAASGALSRGNRGEAARALRLARDTCLACHDRYRRDR